MRRRASTKRSRAGTHGPDRHPGLVIDPRPVGAVPGGAALPGAGGHRGDQAISSSTRASVAVLAGTVPLRLVATTMWRTLGASSQ